MPELREEYTDPEVRSVQVSGLVATEPRYAVTAEGIPVASFRLAGAEDKEGGSTFDERNWYVLQATGALADRIHQTIHKGDYVRSAGTLSVTHWRAAEVSGSLNNVSLTDILRSGITFVTSPVPQIADTPEQTQTPPLR